MTTLHDKIYNIIKELIEENKFNHSKIINLPINEFHGVKLTCFRFHVYIYKYLYHHEYNSYHLAVNYDIKINNLEHKKVNDKIIFYDTKIHRNVALALFD
jgi:hypothetical protein